MISGIAWGCRATRAPNRKAAAGVEAPAAASVSRVYSVRGARGPYLCARGVWWHSNSEALGATMTL